MQYVFCYPDSGDIVIAGPAEAWADAPSGRMHGHRNRAGRCSSCKTSSSRCGLSRQVQIATSRSSTARSIRRRMACRGCSSSCTSSAAAPRRTTRQFIVEQLRDKLGLQVITVGGVSPKTHFAQVMVEADYRMKLIGIGLETPPVRLTSYVERANPSQIARNALQRWYFVPDYQCVRVSEDALAMELVGEGVKLVGENEVVGKDGTRQVSAGGNRASDAFVTGLHQSVSQAGRARAGVRPASQLHRPGRRRRVHSEPGLLRPGRLEARMCSTAKKRIRSKRSIRPSKWKPPSTACGRATMLLTPVGGGVQMRPTEAIEPTNLLEDEEGTVEEARTAIDLSKLAADQWWWD